RAAPLPGVRGSPAAAAPAELAPLAFRGPARAPGPSRLRGQQLRRRRGRRSVDVAGRGHGCPDAFTHRLHDLEDAGPPRRARDLHAVTRYDGLRRLRRLAVDLHMTAATRGGRLGP